jgi:lipid II:glycine glycyltransferase (peptidoglycan interpeptide bridge formation enzyme)
MSRSARNPTDMEQMIQASNEHWTKPLPPGSRRISLVNDLSYEVDTVSQAEWHALLGEFADASIMQSASYAAGRWPRAQLSHLVVSRAGRPVAAAQVILIPIPLLGGGLAYVHFGPLWLHSDQTPDVADLELVVRCLWDEYVTRRRMLLRIRPWASRTAEDVVSAAFAQGGGWTCQQDEFPQRYLVKLDQPMEDLHKSLNGKWRYNLKKSGKHNLSVEHLDFEGAHDPFMKLYESMHARKGFFDKSAIDYLPNIHADLPDGLKPDVWLCYLDGEPVAGAVVSLLGDTTQYLFGASNAAALRVNAGYRLHWEIAGWASDRGSLWYDLGGDSGSQGLRQFKSGMVGKAGRIVPLPGDFEASGSWSSETAVKTMMRLRELGEGTSRALHRLRSGISFR